MHTSFINANGEKKKEDLGKKKKIYEILRFKISSTAYRSCSPCELVLVCHSCRSSIQWVFSSPCTCVVRVQIEFLSETTHTRSVRTHPLHKRMHEREMMQRYHCLWHVRGYDAIHLWGAAHVCLLHRNVIKPLTSTCSPRHLKGSMQLR